MTATIEIKEIHTIEQLHELSKVEKAVWEMDATIPVHQTLTAMHNGGIILGAYDGKKMVGFLYSFPGYDGENIYLCSHMLGILLPYRKSGLGIDMKLKQAEIAERFGYSKITWTFDPLESKNAYINLHKLGARGAMYDENHYGDLNDQLNRGIPTDRILIEWDLPLKEKQPLPTTVEENKRLVCIDENRSPITFTKDLSESTYWFITIPNDFQEMKKQNIQLAKKWRFKTREVFQSLFLAQFQAVDIIVNHENNCSHYIFSKGE